MNLSIKVDPQAREYFTLLTIEGKSHWKKAVGHLITVGKFEFVAFGYGVWRLNVFEKNSGARLFDIPVYILALAGATLEETIEYLESEIAPKIADIITKTGVERFAEIIKIQQEKAISMCGEMPPVGKAVNVLEGVE